MTRIGFIADNLQYLSNLKSAIRLQPDMVCAVSVLSVESFWEHLPPRSKLDIIFLDIDLPAQSGIQAIPALRKRFEQAEIIVLANCEDDKMLLNALSAGADGYLNKEFSPAQLPQMIKTVQNGGALLSPRMTRMLVEYFKPANSTFKALNAKEEQLLRLFYEGNTYEESASVLGLSIDGVKYHVKNIYRKLNVDNKVDALRLYREGLKLHWQ